MNIMEYVNLSQPALRWRYGGIGRQHTTCGRYAIRNADSGTTVELLYKGELVHRATTIATARMLAEEHALRSTWRTMWIWVYRPVGLIVGAALLWHHFY